MIVTIINLIKEENQRRTESGNACYHSVQSRMLSKNLKIRIYKITILHVVL
jgi:hypothetical protein